MGHEATDKAVKKRPHWIMYRVFRILHAFEEILDALTVDHATYKIRPNLDEVHISYTIRKWHPSYWIGWFRCIVLGDNFGSAMYKKESKDESLSEAPTEEV